MFASDTIQETNYILQLSRNRRPYICLQVQIRSCFRRIITPICRCILPVLLHQGNEATLNFYLNNFTDVSALQNAISNIRYLGGNTNTTGGLRLMRTEIFNPANGDRPRVQNVAILITDGIPTREVDLLPGEVETIKSLGIRIVGVGVTNQVSF